VSSGFFNYFSGVPQTAMVEIAMHTMRARLLLARNIHACLTRRKEDQSALARWCRKKPSWINKILSGKRPMHIDDFDRVADFLGIETYQLFQPGISALTERRVHGDRRSKQERRIGHAQRTIELRDRPPQPDRTKGDDGETTDQRKTALPEGIQKLVAEFERNVARYLAKKPGGSPPRPSEPKPPARPRRRLPRRSDAEEQ
jgi:transcriptional regulator with XRE-family HTH domain